jgi:molybdopterin converting factor subunit 1
MRVKLLYFGMLKEMVGVVDEVRELPEGMTVAELVIDLRQWTSNSSKGMEDRVWRSVAVAVNREYAAAAVVLHEGDEVALLPPVSGGAAGER